MPTIGLRYLTSSLAQEHDDASHGLLNARWRAAKGKEGLTDESG